MGGQSARAAGADVGGGAPLILRVDPRSPTPPYEQMRAQITSMVRIGALPEGTRLPSIRQLATDLGLAGGTVARAYRELEGDGIVATRGRHGTVVRGHQRSADDRRVAEAASRWTQEAVNLGLTEEEAVAALRAAWGDRSSGVAADSTPETRTATSGGPNLVPG